MELLIIFILILVNGLFSMTEMAMVSVRKAKLEGEANSGNRSAQKALKFLKHPDKFLSTIQIGITLTGILTGIYSGASMQEKLTDFFSQYEMLSVVGKPLATMVIVVVVTYLTLVFGELVPKRLGLMSPERITKSMAPVMAFLSRVSYPFIWLLSFSTQCIVRLLNIKGNTSSVTEQEIRAMIDQSAKQGEIEVAEQEIIERVFHLGDRNITSLMTHRSEILWLDITMSFEDINEFIRASMHSVYPICEGNADNIRGIVKTKDLYALREKKTLEELCRPALFVPENNTTYQVMEKFKAKGTNVCFIVDEYGSLEGMVTLHDIFEALVGDIPADSDEELEIIKREDGTYWVNAQMHFYDFLNYFDLEDKYSDLENFDTLAGFILHELEHIPKEGEKFEWNEFTFEIADMDGNRIDKVLVTCIQAS